MVDKIDVTQSIPSAVDVIDFNEQDMEYLNQYLAATCFTLLNVNKDYFYKELHDPINQATLKQFAIEKKQRALLIAKIDRAKEIAKDDKGQSPLPKEGEQQQPELDGEGQIELKFSLKVQYLGKTSHVIAFLKRESFQTLELRGTTDVARHLSSQLQILNLGYIGEDSNIFELAATYVEYSLLPLFNTYKTGSGAQSTSDDKGGKSTSGLENVQKNLLQLKVHLVQCQ